MALLLKNSPGSECCLSSGAVRENTALVSPGLELVQGDTLSVTAMELGGRSVPPSLGFQGCFSSSSSFSARLAGCQRVVLPVPGLGVGVQVMERQHTRSVDGMWEVGGGRLALDDTV